MEIVKAFNSNELHTDISIKGTPEHPLFRASDIGLILGICNINQNITNFKETEKVICLTDTFGGNQNVSFLTEKGYIKYYLNQENRLLKNFKIGCVKLYKKSV